MPDGPVLVLHADSPRAGVVLVPDVAGIDNTLRGYAEKLVDEGFTVAMPDLWWRRGGAPPTGTPAEVQAAEDQLSDGECLRDVVTAQEALGALRPRIVIGFGLGGLLARTAACALPGWAGAVEFYGRLIYAGVSDTRPIQPLDLLPGLTCPYLGHFGEADTVCPPHHVDELRRRLGFVCQSTQVLTYPGCGHAFMRPGGAAYNAQAAALAWQRTQRFLDNVAP